MAEEIATPPTWPDDIIESEASGTLEVRSYLFL